jgi:fibronectin-binding autotransporter adhesin
MKLHKNLFLAASLFISLSLLPSVEAATGTWSGPGTTWDNTDTNWTGVTGTPWDIANGPNNTAIFNELILGHTVSGDVYASGITFNGSHTITADGLGTIHLAGTTPTLSAASGFTGTLRAPLAGTSGFTKTGAGAIAINPGTANSLTGTIQINDGQLVVQPAADIAAIANTATLSMNGGSLSFLGASSGTNPRSQTFAGTTIGSGHSAISVNDNGSTSTDTASPTTLTLGTVTRSAGATVNLAYTGVQTTAARRAIQSSSWTAAGTILDSGVAYASFIAPGTGSSSSATSPRAGNHWAASDASGNVVQATYTSNTATSLSGNADINATGNTNTTLASGATITSLRFSQGATRTVTITSGNLTTGGILVASTIGNFTQNITGGTLRSAATVANKDLVIIQNNTGNDLVIASQIVNAAAGATGLTKSGAGRLSLTSSSNNYTGETRINEGTLRIGTGGSGGALSTSSAIVNNATLQFDRSVALVQGTHFSSTISGTGSLGVERTTTVTLNSATNTFSGGVSIPVDGVLKLTHGAALGTGTLTIGNGNGNSHTARLELTNNITVANAISLNGRGLSTADGIRNVSGNNTLSGTITQFAGGGTGHIQSDSGLLTLGTSGSNAITVDSSVSSGRTIVLRGAGDGNVAGKIVDNTPTKNITVTKDGDGTWTLSDANTYTGTTSVNQGTLAIGSGGSIASSSQIIVGANTTFDVSAVSFTLGASTAQKLSGNGTVNGAITVGANGTLAIGSSPGPMTFAGNLNLEAGSMADFEINDFTLGNHDLAKAATAGTQTVGFNGGILNLLFQSGFNTTGSVTIFDFDTYSGTGFTSVISTGLAAGYTASFDETNGMVTVVPEPRAALLGGLGMLALLRRRRGA